MSALRLRVHSARDFSGRDTTVVGMSRSVPGFESEPQFTAFLDRHEIESNPLPEGLSPQGGISERYSQLRPRLTDEQLQEFGAICVGGTYDGKKYTGCVDFDDAAYVLDNRTVAPGRDSPDNIIARG